MEYVFPVPKWLRGCLLKQKRLYAFPIEPELNSFILDSGAFALSKSGRRMDDRYFEQLYLYYSQYPGCKVAPDVFMNPIQTMKNFQFWIKKYSDCQVWPVIQFQTKIIDWNLIKYQLDFYSEICDNNIKILFFSNPSLRSYQYPKDIFPKIKDFYAVDWIHNLGAGWNIQDIQGYMHLSGLDSIDSIAYYNSVHTKSGNWNGLKGTRKQKALANAEHVTKITL